MLKIVRLLERTQLKNINVYRNVRFLNDLTNSSNQKLVNESKKAYEKNKREDDQEKSRKKNEKQAYESYFKDEERKISLITFHEEFFNKNVFTKDAKTFIAAISAFNSTNKNRQLYIDFIYGAILKMKEYNAHKNIEAYRKLLELFPVGPLRMKTKWQIEMMHFPRHQNCVIYVLEHMETNGLCPDTEMVKLLVDIFGDWTHAVKKAKRQLYWLPKFKHANRYVNPFLPQFVDQLDLSIVAIERMTSVDVETKVHINLTKEIENDQEDTWIVWGQSTKQKLLLKAHDPLKPVYIEGPFNIWIQNKIVEYFVLKSEEFREINDFEKNDDKVENLENLFTKYLEPKNKNKTMKRTVHEQNDGTIFAICCTGTGTKNSLMTWTNIVQNTNESLRNLVVVYRIKSKSDEWAITS